MGSRYFDILTHPLLLSFSKRRPAWAHRSAVALYAFVRLPEFIDESGFPEAEGVMLAQVFHNLPVEECFSVPLDRILIKNGALMNGRRPVICCVLEVKLKRRRRSGHSPSVHGKVSPFLACWVGGVGVFL